MVDKKILVPALIITGIFVILAIFAGIADRSIPGDNLYKADRFFENGEIFIAAIDKRRRTSSLVRTYINLADERIDELEDCSDPELLKNCSLDLELVDELLSNYSSNLENVNGIINIIGNFQTTDDKTDNVIFTLRYNLKQLKKLNENTHYEFNDLIEEKRIEIESFIQKLGE